MNLTSEKRQRRKEWAKAINNDLTEAIIYFSVSRCSPEAVERFNSARSPEGLKVITLALPLAAAAALCRIWDKTRDTAKITGIADELYAEDPTDAAVVSWRERVKEIAASKNVEALRDWRNDRLAHTRRPGGSPPAGSEATGTVDETDVLERILPRLMGETVVVVEALNRMLDLKYGWTLREMQDDWGVRAADFWRVAAGPHST